MDKKRVLILAVVTIALLSFLFIGCSITASATPKSLNEQQDDFCLGKEDRVEDLGWKMAVNPESTIDELSGISRVYKEGEDGEVISVFNPDYRNPHAYLVFVEGFIFVESHTTCIVGRWREPIYYVKFVKTEKEMKALITGSSFPE